MSLRPSRPRFKQKQQRKRRKQGSRFKQGYYIPKNPEKYVQPIDKTMNESIYPFMRSSWERKFAQWCDSSSLVKKWSTEYTKIQYWDSVQNKYRRYFPDFFVELENRKVVIEIKPKNQMKMQINQDKWAAAREFCKLHNYEFIVITEKELGI